MSSHVEMDLDADMEEDFAELLESEETPPDAFYLALKQALSQLEHHNSSIQAA